ncbi:hypothetical protein [Coleofasciculus sp. FACHB-125]|nr:hypothetical protein [Coleofasciculus sp. FACHB-125]
MNCQSKIWLAIAYSPLGMKTAKQGVSLALTCHFATRAWLH